MIINTVSIKKDRSAEPSANATDPAPPINELIWDRLEAQTSDIDESRLVIASLNISKRNAGRKLCRMKVSFVWNLLKDSIDMESWKAVI